MPTYYYRSGGFGNGGGFGTFGMRSLFPPMIKMLIAVNLVVYVLQHWFIGQLTLGGVPLSRILVEYLALQPIFSDNPFASMFLPWQLVTYQFLHGDFFHVLFNLFALWMFGRELEEMWGGARFLTFYLLCGEGAGLIHLAVNALFFGSAAPTIGASGAVYGILLAFGLSFPDRPIIMFPIFFPIPAKFFVLIFAGIELISGMSRPGSGVAHFAHLGGAVMGWLLLRTDIVYHVQSAAMKIIGFVSRKPRITPQRKIYDIRESSTFRSVYDDEESSVTSKPSAPKWFRSAPSDEINTEAPITQETIDKILDKISKKGYQSLSDREKEILQEASKRL